MSDISYSYGILPLKHYILRYYASLGAVLDFHDNLLIYAYEQQVEIDNDNVAYYLECLQGLQVGRGSEALQVKVDVEAANERISLRDIRKAYRDLGLESGNDHEDNTIIGVFNARIADAPKQEDEMRRALKVIGLARSSRGIQIAASQGNRYLWFNYTVTYRM